MAGDVMELRHTPSALDRVDAIISVASHDPSLADFAAIVEILDRVTQAIGIVKAGFPLSEHVAAHAHLRSALSYERKVLGERMERANTIVKAIVHALPARASKSQRTLVDRTHSLPAVRRAGRR